MAWKPKKKTKTLSYADQLAVKKMLEASKAKRKTLRGHAVLKRDGSQQDVKLSGTFRDEAELNEYAKSFVEDLCKASGKPWKVLEVQILSNAVYENAEDEQNIDYEK